MKKGIKKWSLLGVVSCFLSILFFYHSASFKSVFDKHIDQRINNHWHFSLSKKVVSIGDLFNIPLQLEKWNAEEPEVLGTLKLSKKDREEIKEQSNLLIKHSGNSLVKKWIKTIFLTNDLDTIFIKLKIHGTSPIHYSSDYKSYKIKSPKPINGLTDFSLIRSDDLNPMIAVGNYLADSIGLIAPITHFVTIKENDKKYSYAQLEDIDERVSVQGFDVYRNINERDRLEYIMTGDPHISRWDLNLAHIKNVQDLKFANGLTKYNKLSTVLISDSVVIEDFFNLEYLGKYLAIAYLFNDVHFMIGHNLRLAYNNTDSLFYPIFRIETCGKGVNVDYYKSRFPFLNTWLFASSPTRGESVLGEMWQKLLNNSKVRYYRDKTLYELSNSNLFKSQIIDYVSKNKWFVTGLADYGKEMSNNITTQLQNVSWLLEKHQTYCSYAKIYEQIVNDTLIVIPDALVDIVAISQEDSVILKAELKNLLPDNQAIKLPVRSYNYKNSITGEIIIPANKMFE